MKSVKMKGKKVEDAIEAGLAVLGVKREEAEVKVISEGKSGLLGVIGGEEAEVEVIVKGKPEEEAKEILQDILDKMGFLAAAEITEAGEERVALAVNGEDMGRIIGKEGLMLRALEVVVGSMLWKRMGMRHRVNIDAGGYREKREQALERLAAEVAEEVISTGQEKELPCMDAADRRAIHLSLQDNPKVITQSKGEGKDRRLVISPK